MNRLRQKSEEGQALVEFALIIIVLLLLVFFIVEASRILWSWNMAQNAARAGARYAITGQYDFGGCFDDPVPCESDQARFESILTRVDENLTGLPVTDDPAAGLEDDNFLLVEVYGVQCFDDSCSTRDFVEDFAGEPGQPVMVRVVYNVPIVTPILSGVVSNVRVVGQVMEQNEFFNQLGGRTSGASLPPDPPPAPTAGPSPTPTPTPTNTSTATPTETNTPTPGPSPTSTPSNTPTNTPVPIVCDTQFVDPSTDLIDGGTRVDIVGDIGTTVDLFRLVNGNYVVLVADFPLSAVEPPDPYLYLCPGASEVGFAQIQLPDPETFVEGDLISVINDDDGTNDIAFVGPDAPTPTPTNTPTLQPTPLPTSTATSTPLPPEPFIVAIPSCVVGPNIQFTIQGGNWPSNEDIALSWGGTFLQFVNTPSGFFSQNFAGSSGNDTYTLRAEATISGDSDTTQVTVSDDCGFVTPLPATPTNTPLPADLIIVGQPTPLITRPLAENTPVAFNVVISNTGGIAVNSQFFVDLYLDPTAAELDDYPTSVDINASSGYMAVSSLGPFASRTLTVTARLGFTGGISGTRAVYGMVDSLETFVESDEQNNVAGPVSVDDVTPGNTPTFTPTPSGDNAISGIVRVLLSSWVPQFRARVFLYSVDNDTGTRTLLQETTSDRIGYYGFVVEDLPTDDYYETVACITIDSTDVYTGKRTQLLPGNIYADIFMLRDPGRLSGSIIVNYRVGGIARTVFNAKRTNHWPRMAMLIFIVGLTMWLNRPVDAGLEPEEPTARSLDLEWTPALPGNLVSAAGGPEAGSPRIAATDDENEIMVVFEQAAVGVAERDPYYAVLSGGTWSAPQPIFQSANVDSYGLRAAYDGNGKAHAIWIELDSISTPKTASLVYSRKPAGQNWTTPFTISSIENAQSTPIMGSPALARSSTETLDAVWIQQRDALSNGDVFHARSIDGGIVWGDEAAVLDASFSGPTSEEPAIVVDDSGQLHLVWEERADPASPDIYYVYSDGAPAGTAVTWQNSTAPLKLNEATGVSADSALIPRIALFEGTLYVPFTAVITISNEDFQYVYLAECETSCTQLSNWSVTNISGAALKVNSNTPFSVTSTIDENGQSPLVYFHGIDPSGPNENEQIWGTFECRDWSAAGRDIATDTTLRAIYPDIVALSEELHLAYERVDSAGGADQIFHRSAPLDCSRYIYLPTIRR